MMILLSLDQSTTCSGFAIFKNGQLSDSGAFLPEPNSQIQDRVYQMYKQIRKKIIEEKVDVIIFEDSTLNHINNVLTLKWLSRLQGFIMSLAMEMNIINEMSYATEWRKILEFPVGRTKSGEKKPDLKQIAVDYVNNTYNMSLNKKDNDVAEAICIGEAYLLKNKKKA